ncbi:cuticle protein AM1159-like [Homarus americanus]|uniref:cuticle protein AM1159-like n=1 Tax=Homarus americanus TaxID=6706 RepID=UPI001C460D74|nr:cuticle protein AM1159-like [Homarus americanus]
MKLVILACLAAVAVAAPQEVRPIVNVLLDERVDQGDGNFNYALETDHGINMKAVGTPGSQGQVNIQGSYWMPREDGGYEEVRYVADEFGVRYESPLLPTPHPNPAHVEELLRIAERQRAEGITFE